MQTLEEFKAANIGTRKNIPNAIRDCWGVYDSYKLIRKNHWYNIGHPVSEKDFYYIIRNVNKLLVEEFLKGREITFPSSMGKLELRKYEVGAFFDNGRLKISYPVDWEETWKLWYNDRDAYKEKVVVRHQDQWVYKVHYNKYSANYSNKMFYQFKLNQTVRRALSDNIKQGKIDSLYGSRDKIYKHS